MKRLTLILSLLLPTSALAQSAAPALMPVQGVLTDTAYNPIVGQVSVTFRIYDAPSAGTALHTETLTVDSLSGRFTAYLGTTTTLDLTLFPMYTGLWLGVQVETDPEMTPRFQLATAPFAGFAQYCGESDTLQGMEPPDFAAAMHQHDWSELQNIPQDLADGDDNTTYRAGTALSLSGDTFHVDQGMIEGWAGNVCYDNEPELTAVLDDNYAPDVHGHGWGEITSRPAGLDDGDDLGVTRVTAGPGLSGGPITTSGSLEVDFGPAQGQVAPGDHDHAGDYALSNQRCTSLVKGIDINGNIDCLDDVRFMARVTATYSLAGSGAHMPVDFHGHGTEDHDIGNNFAGNVFRAPVTGLYYLFGTVDLRSVPSGCKSQVRIQAGTISYPGTGEEDSASPHQISAHVSTMVWLNSNDQGYLTVYLDNGCTANVQGAISSSYLWTYFGGVLIR